MNLNVHHQGSVGEHEIVITGSKSESNRLLILQALFESLEIQNISNSDDAAVMKKALASQEVEVDIHHAGTAMRFLTAYFAIQEGRTTVLTGSTRMQERPVGILVDALRSIGASITYERQEGYPPLRIVGKPLTKQNVTLKANVSSQYISALMLIGAALPDGLQIHLDGKITSIPYIEMTLSLLQAVGITATFRGQHIVISPLQESLSRQLITVESDWSSASYFYSIMGLLRFRESGSEKNSSPTTPQITIASYTEKSLQGDAILANIYARLGVVSSFNEDKLTVSLAEDFELPEHLTLDLANSPDIAQTIAVTCLGLGISCELSGLHTLKIKETDRLEALRAEISKLGGTIRVTKDSLHLSAQKEALNGNVSIGTYKDHRMAMAFAPLALRVPLTIEDAGVVSKSYPDFWKDLEVLGFHTETI